MQESQFHTWVIQREQGRWLRAQGPALLFNPSSGLGPLRGSRPQFSSLGGTPTIQPLKMWGCSIVTMMKRLQGACSAGHGFETPNAPNPSWSWLCWLCWVALSALDIGEDDCGPWEDWDFLDSDSSLPARGVAVLLLCSTMTASISGQQREGLPCCLPGLASTYAEPRTEAVKPQVAQELNSLRRSRKSPTAPLQSDVEDMSRDLSLASGKVAWTTSVPSAGRPSYCPF